MKQFDFVIVGFGIAGASMARELTLRGLNVLVIDSAINTATAIAGGTLHPAVLRYYNKVWRADEFWPKAKSFYTDWAHDLQISLIQSKELLRVFDNANEPLQWREKRKDSFWHQYLNPLNPDSQVELPFLRTPFGYGSSHDFWRFDPAFLLNTCRERLIETGQYIRAKLSFDSEDSLFSAIQDLGYHAQSVILAQGFQQEFWPGLPLGNPIQSKQGQYMIIECPGLNLTQVLKSKFFVIPLGEDRYQVGATYPRALNHKGIEESQNKMHADLKAVLTLPYSILEYWTGTRPATKDRKPIIGAFNTRNKIFVYNGLNSRGLLMAPLLAHWLADFMLKAKELPSEVSINRFF